MIFSTNLPRPVSDTYYDPRSSPCTPCKTHSAPLFTCRKELKQQLAATDIADVKVFCSPLTRTLDTAVIVAEELGIYTTDSQFQVQFPQSICLLHRRDACKHN